MLCPHCGQINQGGATTCERCGKPFAIAPSAIPFQAPQAAAANLPPSVPPTAALPAIKSPSVRVEKRGRAPDFNVQCRLCGAITSVRAACQNCGAPVGLIANPRDSTGATFLPIGMAYPPPVNAIQTVPDRPLPPALTALRWNWGACGASLFWLIGHGMIGWALIVLLLDIASLPAYYGPPLYLLIPYSGALLSLLLGAQGHYLAWQKHSGSDITAFLRSETRWKQVGFSILPLKLILLAWLTWTAIHKG